MGTQRRASQFRLLGSGKKDFPEEVTLTWVLKEGWVFRRGKRLRRKTFQAENTEYANM